MRIDPRFLSRRRSVSLALEAIMIGPVVIILVLLSRFILEGMLARHEVAVHARATVVRAAMVIPRDWKPIALGLACQLNPRQINSENEKREEVVRSTNAKCDWNEGESGLDKSGQFFPFVDQAARPASFLHDDLREITDWTNVRDMKVEGTGSMRFEKPPFDKPTFLENRGQTSHEQAQLRPTADLWTYTLQSDERWRFGHDKAVWSQLGNAQAFFSNVFPSRDEEK